MTAALATAARRCVIYVRISDDNLGREAGVTRQRKACQDEAARRGWDVVAVVTDNDRSASEYATKVRDGYTKVRAMVDTGTVDTVLAWSADRLHRRTDELDAWIRHTHGRAVTMYVQGGEADYTSAMGKMAARMNGNMAAYESDVKSERGRLAMAQMRELGQWTRGAAFGWVAVQAEKSPGHWVRRFTGKVDPVEGPAIVKACADLLAGKSLAAIAQEWNAGGLRSTNGATFGTTTVRAILHRGANAALVVHKGAVVGKGNWDAIVDESTWRKVCRLLDDPSRRTSTSYVNVHLGAGIYRCGVCGDKMRSSHSGRGLISYRCRKPGHVTRSAAPVDALVTEYVVALLAAVKPVRLLPVDATDPRVEVDRLRAKLADMAADYAADTMTKDEWITARSIVQAKLDKIADVVAPDPARDLVMATTADGFADLDLAARRMIVARALDVVLAPVARGVRADVADTVKVTPRAL